MAKLFVLSMFVAAVYFGIVRPIVQLAESNANRIDAAVDAFGTGR